MNTKSITMLTLLRSFVGVMLLTSALDPSAVRAAVLQGGVARVNITPPPEMKAILGGYGERMSKPAVGVHDSVWAKALVMTQGERKFALVTADALGFPPGFKAAVMQRLAPDGWT